MASSSTTPVYANPCKNSPAATWIRNLVDSENLLILDTGNCARKFTSLKLRAMHHLRHCSSKDVRQLVNEANEFLSMLYVQTCSVLKVYLKFMKDTLHCHLDTLAKEEAIPLGDAAYAEHYQIGLSGDLSTCAEVLTKAVMHVAFIPAHERDALREARSASYIAECAVHGYIQGSINFENRSRWERRSALAMWSVVRHKRVPDIPAN